MMIGPYTDDDDGSELYSNLREFVHLRSFSFTDATSIMPFCGLHQGLDFLGATRTPTAWHRAPKHAPDFSPFP